MAKIIRFQRGRDEAGADRWQELEVIAHTLDGETTRAAVIQAMRQVIEVFPGTVEPDADLPGFSVHHLAIAVLRAFNDGSAAEPSA